MNENEKKYIEEFLEKMRNILIKKSHDYSGNESILTNFKRLEDIGIDPKLSVFIRLSDKYNRIKNFLKTKELKVSDETIEDTLIDLANYAIILSIAFKNSKNMNQLNDQNIVFHTGELFKKHDTDAGYDVYAKKIEKINDKLYKVHTEVRIKTPPNIWWMLVPRSSLHKKGYMLANNVGIIDPDYRGEIIAVLYKFMETEEDIKEGERIAQIIPMPKLEVNMKQIPEEQFEIETERGEEGFGSTGN